MTLKFVYFLLVGAVHLLGHFDQKPPKLCKPASRSQLAEVKKGQLRIDEFLEYCKRETGAARWCEELTRPSDSVRSYFECSFGRDLPYRLVHPNSKTWTSATRAVKLVQQLENRGIRACEIYFWWRPEPFNTNAGGSATRHPFGTSVDVRFCSMQDMERAHSQLCRWRKQGLLRALGHYGSPELHLGIDDSNGNTWGKDCPKSSALELAQTELDSFKFDAHKSERVKPIESAHLRSLLAPKPLLYSSPPRHTNSKTEQAPLCQLGSALAL